MDDMLALPGPKFARMAHRLFAYQGVLRARAEQDAQEEQKGRQSGAIDLTPELARSHPGLEGLIDYG